MGLISPSNESINASSERTLEHQSCSVEERSTHTN